MTEVKVRSGAAVGWTVFAASMMMIIGSFHWLAGLAGLIGDDLYVKTPNYLFKLDSTTWGWVHLLGGTILVVAGLALFNGAVWARTVGVIVAAASALMTFAWMPAYPVWAITIVAVDVAVVWALTAHGRDITME